MPSIVSFPKILGFVICCQVVMFCSSGEGGVIVSMPAAEGSLRAACHASPSSLPRTASFPLLPCSAEFRLGERRPLPRGDAASESAPPPFPTSLTRASSLPVGLPQPPRTVVAISVVSESGRFPAVPVAGQAVIPLLRALTFPREGMGEDELPADSPITRAAHQFSSVATMPLMTFLAEFKSPEDFARFRKVLGPIVTGLLGVIMKGERDSVETVGKRIEVLEAKIWHTCHEALKGTFKWGSIPAYRATGELEHPYLTRNVVEELYLVRSVLKNSVTQQEILVYM